MARRKKTGSALSKLFEKDAVEKRCWISERRNALAPLNARAPVNLADVSKSA